MYSLQRWRKSAEGKVNTNKHVKKLKAEEELVLSWYISARRKSMRFQMEANTARRESRHGTALRLDKKSIKYWAQARILGEKVQLIRIDLEKARQADLPRAWEGVNYRSLMRR